MKYAMKCHGNRKKTSVMEHITVTEELTIYRVTSPGIISWTKFFD